MVAFGSRTLIAGSLSSCIAAVSLVSSNPEGSRNHSARDAPALAQSRISLLLALEVAPAGRATADRDGAARLDPADERREQNGLERDLKLAWQIPKTAELQIGERRNEIEVPRRPHHGPPRWLTRRSPKRETATSQEKTGGRLSVQVWRSGGTHRRSPALSSRSTVLALSQHVLNRIA